MAEWKREGEAVELRPVWGAAVEAAAATLLVVGAPLGVERMEG